MNPRLRPRPCESESVLLFLDLEVSSRLRVEDRVVDGVVEHEHHDHQQATEPHRGTRHSPGMRCPARTDSGSGLDLVRPASGR